MRKTMVAVLCVLLCLFMVSCSGEKGKLVGKWTGTAALYTSTGPLVRRAECMITFEKGGKAFIVLEGQDDRTVSWDLDGKTLVLDGEKGAYTITDGKLMATFNDGQYIEVISLTK